ncbi:hypothetical protein PV413_14885 [Streptomyces scabiei]|uniref:hypothetical protein n=2 Tax=Streptomyces scabiei TaxID=1930 RepID=UPI001B312BC3|nr:MULTISPECIES: hypothetical protein [Streptomyces]MDW8476392.1 hypothetical protein [Streptomyces scabiei]MDX2571284.1 hypothetical protein [Streptomyces scabiei]MDX2837165.1 hypothetical protein [Streptomyces scabiei]MDX3148729.1 hypothetical protein [Streptomyces scabiei]MDX3157762.1 hypothetical protein [Streptomyces scabiei]
MLSPTEPAPARTPISQVDFELDDFDADEEKYLDFYRQVAVHEDMLVPLAEHHTPNGAHSYYVLFDRTATYGHPGMPQYIAVHLERDQGKETFDFEQAALPLPAMAQSWLIHRGCPPDAIGLNPELGPPSADETTRALERRLAGDGDHYAMGYSYTSDDPDDMVTVVALRALDERSPSPFRVVVEEVDTDAWTHTLREGGFATVDEALQWCEDRLTGEAGPLPPVRPAAAATRPAALPKAPAPRPPGRSR